jgi:hypothetical protein
MPASPTGLARLSCAMGRAAPGPAAFPAGVYAEPACWRLCVEAVLCPRMTAVAPWLGSAWPADRDSLVTSPASSQRSMGDALREADGRNLSVSGRRTRTGRGRTGNAISLGLGLASVRSPGQAVRRRLAESLGEPLEASSP